MHVRAPETHAELYTSEAERLGLPITDYCALVLARAHGLEDPPFIDPAKTSQRLELSMGG